MIAKEFPKSVITLAKYWDAHISRVSLYNYKTVMHDGKKEIICYELSMPRVKEPAEKPTEVDDHLGYITNENAREAATKIIKKSEL